MTRDEGVDGGKPPSFDEAHKDRWEKLAKTVLNFSIGTLWWVKESLWAEKLAPRYDRGSTRKGHPGLSMLRFPIEDLYSPVPMLHGSSRGNGFAARGLNAETPDRKTRFSRVAPLPVHEALPWRGEKRILPNLDKPRLTDTEMAEFEDFLRHRGLQA